MIKDQYKVIIIALVAGAAFWLIDTIIDSLLFFNIPFYDLLIFHIPTHELYTRFLETILFILFSMLIFRYIIKAKEGESRYHHLFDNIYDAIFVMHLTKQNMPVQLIEVNDEACKRLGYTREELLNLSVKDFNSPDQAPHIPARVQRLLAAGHVIFETVLLAKDGHQIPVETNAHLVNFKGKPTILAIARDITARRQAQEALQQAHAELEQRVMERTAELAEANRQLLQETGEHRRTAEALKQSEQELRHLTSQLLTAQEDARRRISQELHDEMGQTLLAMKLQVSSIKDKLLKGKPLKDHKMIVEDCDYLLQDLQAMVEGVRRLSRDLSPSILEDLGLSTAIKNLFDEFCKRHHRIKSCSFDLDEIDHILPRRDQINIYRICQESLTNIGKHSDATQLWLTIKRQNDRVSFVLQDNGKGFDLADTLTRQDQVKGLGLATLNERVRILGGALQIESQKGAGTRLMFEVPLEGRD